MDIAHQWIIAVATLLGALATFTAALGALLVSLRNGRAGVELHRELNSRLTELIEATRAAAHARGLAQGAETERTRAAASLKGMMPQDNPRPPE